MAHLLPQEQQEEITEAGQEAEESVSEQLSPVEMPQPPSGEGDLHHRLGYLEATLRSQLEVREQERAILQQQASMLARLQEQTEIQEEEIAKAKAMHREEKREPTVWERMFGGHSRYSSGPKEQG